MKLGFFFRGEQTEKYDFTRVLRGKEQTKQQFWQQQQQQQKKEIQGTATVHTRPSRHSYVFTTYTIITQAFTNPAGSNSGSFLTS